MLKRISIVTLTTGPLLMAQSQNRVSYEEAQSRDQKLFERN